MSRVLIIEDETITANAVKDALVLHDINADIAANGEDGIKMFKDEDYDLVLLDLKLPNPDVSGEDVLLAIREYNPFVDIIVYSAYSDFADVKKLINIGIDGYISKGTDSDLGELIDKICAKLAPYTEEEVAKIIQKTPEEFFSK